MNNKLEHTTITTNDIDLHVVLAGPKDGSPVILLHGFPEYWRGWSNQIEPLTGAGYRVVVPNQRVYYLRDKPKGVQSYHTNMLVTNTLPVSHGPYLLRDQV